MEESENLWRVFVLKESCCRAGGTKCLDNETMTSYLFLVFRVFSPFRSRNTLLRYGIIQTPLYCVISIVED
jgi:hypothetical protein